MQNILHDHASSSNNVTNACTKCSGNLAVKFLRVMLYSIGFTAPSDCIFCKQLPCSNQFWHFDTQQKHLFSLRVVSCNFFKDSCEVCSMLWGHQTAIYLNIKQVLYKSFYHISKQHASRIAKFNCKTCQFGSCEGRCEITAVIKLKLNTGS